jgi:thymidylate synthase (FAD)
MKIVKPDVTAVSGLECPGAVIDKLEAAGRICYKSEPKASSGAETFVRRLIEMGHESVIEHHSVTFRVRCSRSCAQQWTRHRLASYSMESQRYVDYTSERHGSGDIPFVMPEGMTESQRAATADFFRLAEAQYCALRCMGATPEDARSVLPNATATEFFCTANLREWRHFIKLRIDRSAQKEIRSLAAQVQATMVAAFPSVFCDIEKIL